jgi:Uncharacterized Fe-S protein
MYNCQIDNLLKELIVTNEYNNTLSKHGIEKIFQKPLIGISKGDDYLFCKFKEVVGPLHLTPQEMWLGNGYPNFEDQGKSLRIVSIVFPYTSKIRETYSEGNEFPSELYSLARHFADKLISEVISNIICYIKELGYTAIDASKSPLYKVENVKEPNRIYSTWSERHIAFASALGTFSLHEGLITKVGCNIRLGSFITDLPLEVTPRSSDDPYGNCLFYKNGKCKKCISHCPVSAISENGHDKSLCFKYRNIAREEMKKRVVSFCNDSEVIDSLRAGCALCQFDVPCMDRIPVIRAN